MIVSQTMKVCFTLVLNSILGTMHMYNGFLSTYSITHRWISLLPIVLIHSSLPVFSYFLFVTIVAL